MCRRVSIRIRVVVRVLCYSRRHSRPCGTARRRWRCGRAGRRARRRGGGRGAHAGPRAAARGPRAACSPEGSWPRTRARRPLAAPRPLPATRDVTPSPRL